MWLAQSTVVSAAAATNMVRKVDRSSTFASADLSSVFPSSLFHVNMQLQHQARRNICVDAFVGGEVCFVTVAFLCLEVQLVLPAS